MSKIKTDAIIIIIMSIMITMQIHNLNVYAAAV